MTEQPEVVEPVEVAVQKALTWHERVANTKIVDVSTYTLFADWLKEIKKVVNFFSDETKEEIKSAHALHKALIAKRDRWAGKFEEAEELAKDKMKHFIEICAGTGVELPKIDGISVSETWAGEVVDASLIPREYLTPDLDKLKGVTKSLKEATAIPGWKAKPVRTLAVRA